MPAPLAYTYSACGKPILCAFFAYEGNGGMRKKVLCLNRESGLEPRVLRNLVLDPCVSLFKDWQQSKLEQWRQEE